MRTFGTATLFNGEWHIKCDPHVAMRMKRLFKRSDRGTPGKLKLQHSPEIAADLMWFCSRYPMKVEPGPEAMALPARQHQEKVLRLEQYMSSTYVPEPFPLALPLRSYQAREATIVLENGGLLVADEVGLGKTATGLGVVSDPRARPAVIVTPTHLPKQWAREVRKFLPDANVHVINKATPYQLPEGLFGSPDVLIITYSKLAEWGAVLASRAKAVIFDEVQALRTGKQSQRGAAAAALAEACAFRVGLSATPIYNYGDEIHNVLEYLLPGILGSRAEFLTEWCVDAGGGKHRIKDPRAFGSWAREAFAIVRHTRKDVDRELPDDVLKILQTVDSDAAALDAIKDDAAELARVLLRQGGKGIEKMQAADEFSMKLRQATGIAKAPYVADFVRMLVESGEKVVLCGWHRAVYDVWNAKLADLGVVMYTGSENPAQKAAAVSAFCDPKAKKNVFVMSLRSGEGLDDLQRASSCIVFGEFDWSPGVHEQCIGRLQRDGQPNKVVAYFLMAEEGSDPTVVSVLGVKRAQVEGIRDPQGTLVEHLETDGDRVKQLARDYLKARGIRVEQAQEGDAA
jgi:SNF2 family DNA or RNA helicase